MLDTGFGTGRTTGTDRPRMHWVSVTGPDGRTHLEARWAPTARAAQTSPRAA